MTIPLGQKLTAIIVTILYTRPPVLSFKSLQLPKPIATSNFKLKSIINLFGTINKDRRFYKSIANLLDYK
jgi:hypothetical protein